METKDPILPASDLGLLFWAISTNVVSGILAFDSMALLTPVRVLILSGTFTYGLILLCGLRPSVKDKRVSFLLAGAVALAVLLSSDLDPHYLGGQDQGYYTAMAELFSRGEPLQFRDQFRTNLGPELLTRYDLADLQSIQSILGETTLLFYPLHPALMSLAKQVFGPSHHTISLIICFVIVVFTAYLLTLEITGGRRPVASAAAWLFAANPALVYFAKFPVSEMTATAFLLPAAYHMLVGFRCEPLKLKVLHGIGAILFVNSYCLTRMSFPILIPFLGLVTIIGIVHPRFRPRERSYLIILMSAAMTVCGFSLLYYALKQRQLLLDIIDYAYLPTIYRAKAVIFGVVITLGLWFFISMAPVVGPRLRALNSKLVHIYETVVMPHPGVVLLVLSLPSIFYLTRTGNFGVFNVPDETPGWHMLRFHPLYVVMLLVSPMVFLSIFRVPTDKITGPTLFLVLYVTVTWPVFLSYTSSMPWLYYFGRRLLPEILPFLIILGVISLFERHGSLAYKAIIITVAIGWSVIFSVIQIGKIDGEVGQPFHEIAAHLQSHDTLILSTKEFDSRQDPGSHRVIMVWVALPIRYSLNKNVFITDSVTVSELQRIANQIHGATSSEVYFLSATDLSGRVEFRKAGWTTVDKIALEIRRLSVGLSDYILPTKSIVWARIDLFLTKIPVGGSED
jgi:hypothetical protein